MLHPMKMTVGLKDNVSENFVVMQSGAKFERRSRKKANAMGENKQSRSDG